ncbi:MAG: hypothetical protein ACT4OO_09825 [Nitrospiraceae bacterium]
MTQPLRSFGTGMTVVLGLAVLIGCAGTGEMVNVDVKPAVSGRTLKDAELLTVVIEPFEDKRAELNRVGSRSHLGGGLTYYTVKGGRPADIVVQALAESLEQRGLRVTVSKPGAALPADEPDILLTGRMLDFSMQAKSRFFSTVLDAKCKFVVQARNKVDRSTTIRDVEAIQHQTIFWFTQEDVEQGLGDTLKDALDRFNSDTKIENRALRPRN